MDKKITLFITSCGRSELLHRTLLSFIKFNTYPIEHVIVCEDSGLVGSVDFVHEMLPWPTDIYYNKKRMGQMLTLEKYVKFIKTPYTFHLEDDYEFFKGGFIEKSLEIIDTDPMISQVLLGESYYRAYPVIDYGNPLCYKVMTSMPNDKEACYGDGPLSIFTWQPSLKRTETQRLRIPYEPWDDEYTIQLEVNRLGMYSVIPKSEIFSAGPKYNTRRGFCVHIGDHSHVPDDDSIVKRPQFPDKARIRYADYVRLAAEKEKRALEKTETHEKN